MNTSEIGYNFLKDLIQDNITKYRLNIVDYPSTSNRMTNQIAIMRVDRSPSVSENDGEGVKMFEQNTSFIQFAIAILIDSSRGDFGQTERLGWQIEEDILDKIHLRANSSFISYEYNEVTGNKKAFIYIDDILPSYVATLTDSKTTIVNIEIKLKIIR